MLVVQPAVRNDAARRVPLPAIIEEELVAAIDRALRFAAHVLDLVDRLQRVSDVVVLSGLIGSRYTPLRTRAEHAASPQSMAMTAGDDETVVALTPARRHRQALVHEADRIAEDIVVMFHRERRP